MSRALRSFNVAGLKTVPEVLRAIDRELADLSAIAAETDFGDARQAKQFARNVAYLKTYYERAEALTRRESQQSASRALDRRTARRPRRPTATASAVSR